MGRTACTEPQCLYSRAIPLLPLWAVRPVQGRTLTLPFNSTTGLDRPLEFQKFEVARFQDNRHTNVVRLSALRTGPPLHPRKYIWDSFLLQAESTIEHSATGRIMLIKISKDIIGNQTHDLPACSLNQLRNRVPQEF
jgi:hypothetical protein